MISTDIVALEGALATSVAISIDVLAMANRICLSQGRAATFDVRLTGSGASVFRPFLAFPEAEHNNPALVIVPAQGFSKSESYAKRLAEGDAIEARDYIRTAAASGAMVASSCTGTLLVANSGLLNCRNATTAWWLAPEFREMFPHVLLNSNDLVVTDGPFTTAGAAMAQMDLMVGLIARHAGPDVAEGCARRMVLDERRSQVPYMAIGLLAGSNESISRAAAWARSRLNDELTVQKLAAVVGQSPRTFARRVQSVTGLSPIQFLQQLRMERAVELLETTILPFEEVAFQVGYRDPSTLRSVMRKRLGVGPREIRSRARSAQSSQQLSLAHR